MSNLFPDPELEALPQREVRLGELSVVRLLPVRGRRMIGPWCFVDRFGPLQFREQKPMDVAPHPHIGLQTLTWLLEGEVLHRDSLGSECMIRPGHLSLMTAGRGVSHTEETPPQNSGVLNGVQFWIALPEQARHGAPEYFCRPAEMVSESGNGVVRSLHLAQHVHSPMMSAEGQIAAGGRLLWELRRDFEYGVMLVQGDATANGVALEENVLYYQAPGAQELELRSVRGATVLCIGGVPFAERILMWWNFVARTPEEIQQARQAWEAGEAFGQVARYEGERLRAPEILGKLTI